MERKNLINEIIKLQTQKNKAFKEVAKKEDLEKLSNSDLNMVYNISKQIKEVD